MRDIRYTGIIDTSIPCYEYKGIAKYIYTKITGNTIPVEERFNVTNNDTKLLDIATEYVSIKELCKEIIDIHNLDELKECFFMTEPCWPYTIGGAVQSVSVPIFVNTLLDSGYDNIKITPLQVLQIAGRIAKHEEAIYLQDNHIFAAICAYYSSFDERFQVLFYPNNYHLELSADSAHLFQLSSLISKSITLTKIYDISPTSLWLTMLVQEPIPSLLYDYLNKSKQSTGINESLLTKDEDINDTAMSSICENFLDDVIAPEPISLEKVNFTEDLYSMVADVIFDSPATMKDIVFAFFYHQHKQKEVRDLWFQYCQTVEYSCDFAGIPIMDYPDYIVLSSEAIEYLSILMKTDNLIPLRRIIASSSMLYFLDETLKGTEAELVRLYKKDLSNGIYLLKYKNKSTTTKSITNEDIKVLLNTRKLTHFAVPSQVQQLIIANMISRNSSIVSLEDLIRVIEPQSIPMILSDEISPYTSHAGIEIQAAKILATVKVLMNRLLMTISLDSTTVIRMYIHFLATIIKTIEAFPKQDCCGDIEQWLISLSVKSFDPRIHVFFTEYLNTIEIPMFLQKVDIPEPFSKHNNSIPYLTKYGTDLLALAKNNQLGVGIVGRDDTIALVETILSRRDKSNPLLLAPAGAGKSAIVEAIAHKIVNNQTALLNSHNLYQLDITDLAADGCTSAMMAERLEIIVKEAIESNSILFIDEIHMINSLGSGELNVGNIMKPFLARGGLKLIGATTEREYNYTIAKDKALARRFSAIHLPELSFDALLDIIHEKQKIYGDYHKVKYEKNLARNIIILAKEYMSDRESPDRELDILDTSASIANKASIKTVTIKQIIEAIRLLTSNNSVKTSQEIAFELCSGEYSNQELDEMFPRVAGQYEAKRTIAKRIFESKLDISTREKPRNIFMFVGESGVGKSYTAQEMTKLLDATESDVLLLNLNEYQDKGSYTKLVGAGPQWVGYNEGGILTNFVKAHPHGVVILDELDKAYDDIQQFFLGVFDNGKLRGGDGQVADCHSITFVCTANMETENKKNALGFTSSDNRTPIEKNEIMEQLRKRFGEPFVSRLDEVVIFENLTDDNLIAICKLSFETLIEKLLQRHEVDLTNVFTEEDMIKIVQEKLAAKKLNEIKDARSIWAEVEKEIMPYAIALLK